MKIENIFANFHDIVTPPPVSMQPQTDGYLLILILLFSFIFPLALYLRKRYLRNLYRKQAIKELSGIDRITEPQEQLQKLLDLLKRVALSAYPRVDVARLSGEKWWQFLYEKSRLEADEPMQCYCENLYLDTSAIDADQNRQVARYVKRWIKKHKGAKID